MLTQIVTYQQTAAGTVSNAAYRLSEIMPRPPQILPFIVQNLELFFLPGGAGAMVTMSKSSWVKGLVAYVEDRGRQPIPAIVRQHFRPNRGVMVIPFMRNLRSVFERSHEFGRAVVDLHVDMWGPSARDRAGQDNLINTATHFYTSLATFLEYVSTH